MVWFLLSLATAIAVALRDVSVKAYEDLGPSEAALLELAWALPLFAAGGLLVVRPPLDTTFWLASAVALPLNILAYLLYLQAIKVSPLSLSVPFLSFTPVFIILTGALILGERVSLTGALGIMLVTAGGYILHFDGRAGVFGPFRAVLREAGSLLMLAVAFLFAFCGVLGKLAMLHSSPLFFSYWFFVAFSVLTVLGLMIKRGSWKKTVFRHPGRGAWLGILFFAHITCHGLAMVLTEAAYMVAVKRTSVLFSILLAWLILREGQIVQRGLGTCLMFTGTVLIVLYA